MKRALCVVVSLLMLSIAGTAFGGAINVDVYSGFSDSGGGQPYSNFVGAFAPPDIMFATNTGYNWHPFGLESFGAEITGHLNVASTGMYEFTLNSDDGSLLFIDNALVIDNGGPHPPGIKSSLVALASGLHSFEVQFFEDFGGPSGVDLILPSGVSYAEVGSIPVPEPSIALLLGTAVLGIGIFRRRYRD